MDVEASMTRAISRLPVFWKRARLSCRSKRMRATPESSSNRATPRVSQRAAALLSTKEAPRAATPKSTRGNTKIHGTLESGGTKGRARARASRAMRRQRAAISSMSSHSIRRRRIATVSKRNRIAPQSSGLADCRRIMCRMMGTRTPASPISNHGLRKSICLTCRLSAAGCWWKQLPPLFLVTNST